MENTVLLYYVGYSENFHDFVEIGVYFDEKLLRKEFNILSSDPIEPITENISSDEVLTLIDKYGCKGFEIY